MRVTVYSFCFDQQSSILPVMSGWVLVVLKLLLATVSAATGANPPPSATGNGFPPGVSPR
jgi:hypothetical protein